ncbi:MAG: TlyA family RNA methyltransferase [Micrococcales bacterium]|nr:TlyA family RNA methyltransferase [Micrococcales bacterium]
MTVTQAPRLDAELVRRGLARSRRHAGELIAAGRVRVDGAPARRAATAIDGHRVLVVGDDPADRGYASRAGYKLAGALDAWQAVGLTVEGCDCLDVGASTGGFTDVLLRRGARHVVALDVGHGQLRPHLAADPRVASREGVNARELVAGDVTPVPSVVVADLSFISLRLVLAPLAEVARPDADLVVLVKPQFEVGRQRLGAGGVVRDAALRRQAVLGVLAAAQAAGLAAVDLAVSSPAGQDGNVEFFCWLRGGAAPAGGVRLTPARIQDVLGGQG